MTISGTTGQPFIALCLIAGGAVSAALYFIVSKVKTNPILDQVLAFFTTITGALIYFSLLFLLNGGEMRLYTLLCYALGAYIGYQLADKIARKLSGKKEDYKK
jgi:uncharacterized membrane protein YfcA